jgi:hypothetical protein
MLVITKHMVMGEILTSEKSTEARKILTTTRTTILSCLSIFQTLKAKRLGRNQRTRREEE